MTEIKKHQDARAEISLKMADKVTGGNGGEMGGGGEWGGYPRSTSDTKVSKPGMESQYSVGSSKPGMESQYSVGGSKSAGSGTKSAGGNTQTNSNGSKGNQQVNTNGDNNASF